MDKTNRKSVLIVDDENSNIIALTHILSSEYTVYAAKNGKNAIAAAQKYLPDVILLDIIMPEMDGYEVLAVFKASEVMQNIPVIFITGLSNSEAEEKGLSLGASDYIGKPFSPAIVKLRIRNQIKMLDQLNTIERLSMLDHLTNLPNRRSSDIKINAEWNRAMRDRTPISILMLDVDRFKNYNDSYGHNQGDKALLSVAETLSATIKRSSDFAARWGGEEFIVLLPGTDLNGAYDVAEQIRKNIEKVELPCVDEKLTKVTISIGINIWEHGQNMTIEEFVAGADKALYKAKEKGRNRVCHFV